MNESAIARIRNHQLARRGGIGLVAFLLAAAVAAKSATYYGTLLRGFDSQFYYAAARSFVVSGDWDVTNDLPLSPWQGPFRTQYGVPMRDDGGTLNVFPMGLSLVEASLLAPAVTARRVAASDAPPGYSAFEVGWVAVGLILLTAVGLQITYGLVRSVAAPHWGAAVVFAAWLGTPLFFYTSWFPFSAHPTTFAIMTMMLAVAAFRLTGAAPNRWLAVFGALAALLFLVRPHETTLTLLLTAWMIPALIRRPLAVWLPGAVGGLALCVLAVTAQALVHRVNVGHLALIAHGRHAHPAISGFFDLTAPHFDIVLLSGGRGLFFVTPIIALSMLGFIIGWRTAPGWAWVALINAAIQTCILAFWSDPIQGDSFGIRLWGEQLAAVACGLALLTHRAATTRRRLVLGSALVILTGWSLLLAVTFVTGRMQPTTTCADAVRNVAATLHVSR